MSKYFNLYSRTYLEYSIGTYMPSFYCELISLRYSASKLTAFAIDGVTHSIADYYIRQQQNDFPIDAS